MIVLSNRFWFYVDPAHHIRVLYYYCCSVQKGDGAEWANEIGTEKEIQ